MSGDKILIVDDEKDILELIGYNLEKEGYKILKALSGEAALRSSRLENPDLILLDLMLPGIDGLDVLKKLKKDSKTTNIPTILLTAKGEEADIVAGLELGADDYITKPFSPRVLLARIRAVLRRQNEETVDLQTIIRIHDLEIHPGRRSVLAKGEPVELTFTEFQILFLLARRPGWVFTRSQIVDGIRGDDYPVTDRSVDVQIVGLRKKLGPYGKYIETVRGVGYRFKDIS
jgi:two-component system, OmpR family, alkaline phosphatase synthesis response regulator PhoP